jgi:hypothetical protein
LPEDSERLGRARHAAAPEDLQHWDVLQLLTLTNNSFDFLDTQTNPPQRFYQVKLVL